MEFVKTLLSTYPAHHKSPYSLLLQLSDSTLHKYSWLMHRIKIKSPANFFYGMNKTFLGADLSFFNQSYSGGIRATKKPTGYWRYYHSKCRPSRVMRAAMEPGVHTMSDELILQIPCNIFLAFKWMLMMTSGQNISHYRTAKLSVHVWNHDLIWWQNKIDTLHVLSSSPNIHSSFRL